MDQTGQQDACGILYCIWKGGIWTVADAYKIKEKESIKTFFIFIRAYRKFLSNI